MKVIFHDDPRVKRTARRGIVFGATISTAFNCRFCAPFLCVITYRTRDEDIRHGALPGEFGESILDGATVGHLVQFHKLTAVQENDRWHRATMRRDQAISTWMTAG